MERRVYSSPEGSHALKIARLQARQALAHDALELGKAAINNPALCLVLAFIATDRAVSWRLLDPRIALALQGALASGALITALGQSGVADALSSVLTRRLPNAN